MIASNNLRLFAALGLLLLSATVVQAQEKTLSALKVSFRIKNAGIGVEGSFGKAVGYADLQASNPSASRFRGEVQAASIETGIGLRNQHLRKGEYFDVARFPLLRMQAVAVQASNGAYAVTWDLTMKGKTRRVQSEVKVLRQDGKTLLQTAFSIDRRDWNIGGNSLTMGDEVKVDIRGILPE